MGRKGKKSPLGCPCQALAGMLSNPFVSNPSASDEQEKDTPVDDLQADIKYVNSLLVKCNLDSSFPFLSLEEGSDQSVATRYEISRACKILIPLLITKSKEQSFRTDVEKRIQMLAEELAEKSSVLTAHQRRIEDLEREANNLKNQNQHLMMNLAKAEKGLQGSREEANRLRSGFQLKEKMFIHELRKREKDLDRLKEQLQSTFNREYTMMTMSKDRAELTKFDLEGDFGSRLSLHGEPMPRHDEDEVDFVDRISGLEDENSVLRQLIVDVAQLLDEMKAALELEDGQVEDVACEKLAPAMPVQWSAGDIKNEIETNLGLLSKRIAHLCGIPLSSD